MATAQQVLDLARCEIGTQESPAGSNRQKYGHAYGLNGQRWCVIFCWWVLQEAGVALPKKTAGVYDLLAAFKAAGRLYSTPQPGDIAFWSYGQGHAELVETVPLDGRSVVDIGGNTSSGDGSPDNGGEVARKRRARDSQCLGFGRPIYSNQPAPASPPAPQPPEDGMDRLTITWPDGTKTVGKPDGSIDCWGTDINPVPSVGSFGDLRPSERAVLHWPLQSDFDALIPVDLHNKSAGYIACVIGVDGKGHQFKFDAGFKQSHGL